MALENSSSVLVRVCSAVIYRTGGRLWCPETHHQCVAYKDYWRQRPNALCLSTSTQDQWQMMKASICFVLRRLHCTIYYTVVLTEFTYVYMRNRKCSASRYCLQSRADRTSGNATGSAHYCYYSRTIWNGCSVRIPRRVLIGPPRIASTSFRVEPLVMERSDRRHVSLGSTFLHSKCWEDTGIPTQPNGKWTGSREPVELRKPKSDELIWNNEFMNGNAENLQLYEYQYTVMYIVQ